MQCAIDEEIKRDENTKTCKWKKQGKGTGNETVYTRTYTAGEQRNKDSVVDPVPNPVGSETFRNIRIQDPGSCGSG